MTDRRTPAGDVVVLRCSACGDTFPATRTDAVCPTCGASETEVASEPLL